MAKFTRLLPLAAILAAGAIHAAPAAASTTQVAIMQDDTALMSNPVGTLATMKSLGVTRVRVSVIWGDIAPAPRASRAPAGFNASDPAAYGTAWQPYDAIDRAAAADGISVYFMLTGPAPQWATGAGEPRGGPPGVWKPSAPDFGAFVHAAGLRYDGSYVPAGATTALPAVRFWSIWNEPNYGPDLAPQGTDNGAVEVAPALYRGLLDAAWNGLVGTGHGPNTDTILIGEVAPRGQDSPIGNFNGTKPLRFLRALYCVDSHFHRLLGNAARLRGCPTTIGGTRAFRRENPALFFASGFADHPYALQANPGPPNVPTTATGRPGRDPDFTDLPQIGALEATLDRLNRIYGSSTRFPIWDTEFGYRTHPPDPHVHTPPATAAYYMNWAEYISFRNPRLVSYMQYELYDPPSGVFASGLFLPDGAKKATYYAYVTPLFLPATAFHRGHSLEVWGGVRPAAVDGQHTVAIQFQRGGHGAWVTLTTVTLHNVRGYFDTRVRFPGSGNVRLAWTPPTGGPAQTSRTVAISLR